MEDLGRQVTDVRDQAVQAIDMLLADLRQKWAELSGGPSMTEGLRRFIAAVDWSERWIQALLAFHLTLLILVVALRRVPGFHFAVFVGIMPIVYCAERINRLAGQHWRAFAKQNYFDPQGIFTSAVLSAPLLLIMFVLLVNYLITTSVLLVRMKRKELEFKARQRRRAEIAAAGAAGGAGGGEGGAAGGRLAAAGEAKKER
ncbi:Transmembrane 18 [Chlorella sorokiniana]|uniref:Transmembrane 18 n=1 Tax=Chlorella sorokiniana TaxID=3076 RepID=A0A2P6U3C8_CHLSO|nr:Transmembrane 18 [Chlorella sorokiniana]|eukprot:PRW60822.1 Transmembrane 18 [Chlorella sorokiniana]